MGRIERGISRSIEGFDELVEGVREAIRNGAHQFGGDASIVDACVRRGLPSAIAREAYNTALAYEARPQVKVEVEALNIPRESAAVLGKVYANPAVAEKRDWLLEAQQMQPWELREAYRDDLDEVVQGKPVEPVTVRLPKQSVDDLKRLQVVISRTRHRVATRGEVVSLALATLRAKIDPHVNGRGAGTRRVPDTVLRPFSRYVPLSVRLQLEERHGHKCAVPGCSARVFLDASHRVAHRFGSGREEEHLVLLCHRHNMMMESGDLIIRGPPDAPEFYNRLGERLTV